MLRQASCWGCAGGPRRRRNSRGLYVGVFLGLGEDLGVASMVFMAPMLQSRRARYGERCIFHGAAAAHGLNCKDFSIADDCNMGSKSFDS